VTAYIVGSKETALTVPFAPIKSRFVVVVFAVKDDRELGKLDSIAFLCILFRFVDLADHSGIHRCSSSLRMNHIRQIGRRSGNGKQKDTQQSRAVVSVGATRKLGRRKGHSTSGWHTVKQRQHLLAHSILDQDPVCQLVSLTFALRLGYVS
jgi:hypothetical protein